MCVCVCVCVANSSMIMLHLIDDMLRKNRDSESPLPGLRSEAGLYSCISTIYTYT